MRVAFQGERGAYSEEAITQRFGGSVEPSPRQHLRGVFDAVEAGEADLGMVPVENTLEGSVPRSYDLLLERTLRIRGEAILRVVHCVVANPGVRLAEIRRVYSHPQALGQCRAYIEERGFEPVAAYDTAGSAKMIKCEGLRDAAAIASGRAAEVYGMEVLARGVETHSQNYTRFVVVGQGESPPTGEDKTSIAFVVENRPGALIKALEPFACREINLTKIESRPQMGRPWEYTFFTDFEGYKEEPEMKAALEELRGCSRFLKVLGSYPRA